jgi:hypothetical protein
VGRHLFPLAHKIIDTSTRIVRLPADHDSQSIEKSIAGVTENWRDGPNGRESVSADYQLLGGGAFGFKVGSYDPSRALTIDPAPQLAQ